MNVLEECKYYMFNLVEKINVLHNTCHIAKTLAMLDWSLQN